jgi:hypothetical protein
MLLLLLLLAVNAVAAAGIAAQQSSRCSAHSSNCACDTVMRLTGATDSTQQSLQQRSELVYPCV